MRGGLLALGSGLLTPLSNLADKKTGFLKQEATYIKKLAFGEEDQKRWYEGTTSFVLMSS